MRLEGKVAIITGSARGIGKKTAEVFASEGARVVVADFDKKNGAKTAEELKNDGAETMFVEVNVADVDSVKNMVDKTIDKYGKINILVNNAGVTADTFLVKMDESAWDKVVDVNLKGVFNCSKSVAQKMINQGDGGVILNASSVVGLYGNIGQTNYAATKFGVIGLTKTWSKELGPKGIRVNAVAPGFTKTDMISTVPEKILNSIKEKTPLRKLGEPEDIANAYLYLASDDAAFITGEILSVDGGIILG